MVEKVTISVVVLEVLIVIELELCNEAAEAAVDIEFKLFNVVVVIVVVVVVVELKFMLSKVVELMHNVPFQNKFMPHLQ